MGRILVVDDHQDNNEMLCRLLRSCGHQPVSAFSGEGALATLRADKPDLVILDVMMPGMDGLEVLRHIRSNPAVAATPVVLFSGVADPQFTQHALNKGANDFWIKGTFDMSQLDDMVAKYVPTPA